MNRLQRTVGISDNNNSLSILILSLEIKQSILPCRGVHPLWGSEAFPPESFLDCHEKFRKWHFSMWLFPPKYVFSTAKISDDLSSKNVTKSFMYYNFFPP